MSLIINYVSNTVSAIATDTKVTYEDGSSKEEKKLMNVESDGMGWASTGGFGSFIDHFNKKITTNTISQATDMQTYYDEVVKEMVEQHPDKNADINDSVSSISWVSINEEGIFTKLALVSNNEQIDGMAELNNDHFFISYPKDFRENKENIENIESNHNMNFNYGGNLKNLLGNILNIFQDISLQSDEVSNECNIGLQFIDQQGIHKAHATYDISKFEEEKRTGTVSLRIKIIETIPFKAPN